MSDHEYTFGALASGLGAGALGFLEGLAQLGPDAARFRCLGGVDIDEEACQDFEMLTGVQAVRADLSKMTPAELRAAWGERRPDCVFTSSPCKGFSGLLSAKTAEAPKYQAMNQLVLQSFFLAVEAWPGTPPPLLVLENVPRIASRGRKLLRQLRQLLMQYGYVSHASTHDCGEIGGLAQHRRRYLLVARHEASLPAYVYQPPKKRVRGCGEVLGELPLPEDPRAGELHRLPRISWLNWVRLALIPAGGDWRDLPGMQPLDPEARRAWEQEGKKTPGETHLFKGKHGVMGWSSPSRAVIGGPSNGAANVADPRATQLALGADNDGRHENKYSVGDWGAPARAVIGATRPGSGGPAVADPRLGLARTAEGAGSFKGRPGLFGVGDWSEPLPAVVGSTKISGGNATAAVADPRVPAELLSPLEPGAEKRSQWARYDVRAWEQPARTVAGPGVNGGFGVADPRPGRDYRNGTLGVIEWGEPAKTVTGESWPLNGPNSVADPRLTCTPRFGVYGVVSWETAAATITGNARIDNGPFSVADPRKPPVGAIPVIIAADGTWHRPLTTLELAALQEIPTVVHGQPLKLAGRSVSRWRERIGNAVPRGAARAIAGPLLKALLAGTLGTWFLSPGGEPIWVRRDGLREDEDEHQLEMGSEVAS